MPARKSPFQDLLKHEAAQAGFLAVLLVNPQGEAAASYVAPGLTPLTAQTPLETARRIFGNPDSRAELAHFQESVFYDLDGRRLVCRSVQLSADQPYLLIVLAPAEGAYRRGLSNLIKRLQDVDLFVD
jgi:hypothetical protein